MRIALMLVSTALLAPAAANAQADPLVSATSNLRQVQQASGRGVQLYSCQPVNSKPAFVFLGPSAKLYQGESEVATHGIGPVWQWKDGSGVFGTVTQTRPSADAAINIPMLVLSTQPFGTRNGVLSAVSVVTRTDAIGGTAPTGGCDASHLGTVASVPYIATYTFFTAKQ